MLKSKWDDFIHGFWNFFYAYDCYEFELYTEFWESLSCGWYEEYIYPYDDWYHPTISPERKLRLAQK